MALKFKEIKTIISYLPQNSIVGVKIDLIQDFVPLNYENDEVELDAVDLNMILSGQKTPQECGLKSLIVCLDMAKIQRLAEKYSKIILSELN